MVTINTDVVAAHAQHAQLFATQLQNAETHCRTNGDLTAGALGGLGLMLFLPMTDKMWAYASTVRTLSERGDEVESRIDATARTWAFADQANVEIADTTRTSITDPDLWKWMPTTINDFPDSGMVSDIGQFAANCPQYAEAGAIPVVLGSVAFALDVLGWLVDPVGTVTGSLAGVIIDLCFFLREPIDFLLGDPGSLQEASTAYEQTAQYLSEAAHAFAASLDEITPQTWDEPGASDVYLRVAENLVQLTVLAGEKAIEISGELLMIGSFLGDVRSVVIEKVLGWVIASLIEGAIGGSFAAVTFGASLAVAAGIIETQAVLTATSIALTVAAAALRLGAAALVAQDQTQSYNQLVADIKS